MRSRVFFDTKDWKGRVESVGNDGRARLFFLQKPSVRRLRLACLRPFLQSWGRRSNIDIQRKPTRQEVVRGVISFAFKKVSSCL